MSLNFAETVDDKFSQDINLNSQIIRWTKMGIILFGVSNLCLFCLAPSAVAETLQGGALEFFQYWLEEIENLGPLGPGLFIATVVFGEMIPLLPTQPLCLAAGLLFGGLEGAFFVLIGVSIAAILAFLLSRQFGDTLVKRIINLEEKNLEEDNYTHKNNNGNNNNNINLTSILSTRFQGIQEAVKNGGLWQQFVAVLFLRLTPVTPYSISNYVLGLTPLKFEAFVGGTVTGMAVWSLLYASIGGASRALLKGGSNIAGIMADLSEKAAVVTEEGAGVAVVVGISLLLLYYSRQQQTGNIEKNKDKKHVENEIIRQNQDRVKVDDKAMK